MTNSATRNNLFQDPFDTDRHSNQLFKHSAHHGNGKLFLAALLSFVCLLVIVPFAAAQGAATFRGEITDEHLNCIQTPVKAAPGVTDKVSCVLYWAHFVQPPSKYVLYNATSKTTYQLSNQDLVQPFVGEKVEVTGKLDAATKTIQVTDIKVPDDNHKKS